MRFERTLIPTIMVSALILSGCVNTITGDLGELVSEPLNPEAKKPLPDYKIDRLNLTESAESPQEEVELVSFESANTQTNLPNPADIEIFNDLPSLEHDPAANQRIEVSQHENTMENQFQQELPINPVRDAIQFNNSNTLEPMLRIAQNPLQPTVPVNVAPENPDFEPENDDIETTPLPPETTESTEALTSLPETFVSDQIKNLLPPFANHPDTKICEYDFCTKAETESESETTIEPLAENPFGNSFINELISESMVADDDQISFVAATEPIEPATKKLTWDQQLKQTIAAIENETNNAFGEKRESLESATVILRSLQTNLLDADQQSVPTSVKNYWIHQINALRNIIESSIDNQNVTEITSATLADLQLAAGALRESAALRLTSPALCRKVAGFGQYECFETGTFNPNQSVLVYCEIENFTPDIEFVDDHEIFLTRISSSYTITDESGKVVQSHEFPMVSDEARKLRHDFFMHLPIRFADLRIGEYELQVQVHDFGSGKSAILNSPIHFSIR